MTESIWWYVARSAGIVAWILLATSVLWGAALASRLFVKRPKAPWILDLHGGVSNLAVVFTGIHLVGLYLDGYVEFGLKELLVPLTSTYRPVAVAWGIVALYLLAALQTTSVLKKRMSHKTWRKVHHLALPTYVLATVHVFTAGTDASHAALSVAAYAVSGLVLALGLTRLWAPKGRLPRPAKPATAPARPSKAPASSAKTPALASEQPSG